MGRNVCHRAEPASRWTTRWRAHRVCAGAARSPDRLAAHDSSLDSDGHLLLARLDGVGGLATDQRHEPSYGSRLAEDLRRAMVARSFRPADAGSDSNSSTVRGEVAV